MPKVLLTHGLISQSDGEIGVVMLELGQLETFLTRKVLNLETFSGLPCDKGSLFIQMMNSPDDIELDNLDKAMFKVKVIDSISIICYSKNKLFIFNCRVFCSN